MRIISRLLVVACADRSIDRVCGPFCFPFSFHDFFAVACCGRKQAADVDRCIKTSKLCTGTLPVFIVLAQYASLHPLVIRPPQGQPYRLPSICLRPPAARHIPVRPRRNVLPCLLSVCHVALGRAVGSKERRCCGGGCRWPGLAARNLVGDAGGRVWLQGTLFGLSWAFAKASAGLPVGGTVCGRMGRAVFGVKGGKQDCLWV